jgi:hypothetical protein
MFSLGILPPKSSSSQNMQIRFFKESTLAHACFTVGELS